MPTADSYRQRGVRGLLWSAQDPDVLCPGLALDEPGRVRGGGGRLYPLVQRGSDQEFTGLSQAHGAPSAPGHRRITSPSFCPHPRRLKTRSAPTAEGEEQAVGGIFGVLGAYPQGARLARGPPPRSSAGSQHFQPLVCSAERLGGRVQQERGFSGRLEASACWVARARLPRLRFGQSRLRGTVDRCGCGCGPRDGSTGECRHGVSSPAGSRSQSAACRSRLPRSP